MSDHDWIAQLTTAGPQQTNVVIQVKPDYASKISGRLEPYKNLPEKFRPALEGLAEYLAKTAIPKVFNEEGPGWRKLSKRTQKERRAAGFNAQHPILVRTGDLYKELTDRSHPKHIEVIKVGKNARLVYGGSSTKFIRNQAGNTTLNIPSRPMIPGTGRPLTPEQQNDMRQILNQKILEAIGR